MQQSCSPGLPGARAAVARAAAALGAACVLAAAPAAAGAQSAPGATPSDVRPAAAERAMPEAARVGAPTPASAGDSLRVTIWREPDLSRSYWIDESGYVNLPKIGAVRAAGQPQDSLKARIVAAYQTYLTHTAIDVAVLHRVQVRGAVRSPGVYYVNETMSLGDALALAGGSTAEGEPNKARLIRDGAQVRGAVVTGARIGQTALRSGDQIYVPERSWMQRNMGFVATALGASATIVVALIYH